MNGRNLNSDGDIYVSGTGETEPAYSSDVIPMSAAQYAVLTAERITVTLGAS